MTTKEIPVRAARVGDLVQTKDNPDEVEVVKKVEVILTLGNGAQDIYDANSVAVWVQQEPLPDVGDLEEELGRSPDVPPWAAIQEDVEPLEGDPMPEVSEKEHGTLDKVKAAKKR